MSSPFSRIRPADRRQTAGEQIDEGRLAGAIRPDQRMPRAGFADGNGCRWRPASAPNCFARPMVSSAAVAVAAVIGRAEPVDQAENAAAGEHHDQHQQQADPEHPELGLDLRQLVLRDHVDGGADEGAVDAADAAEHQHDDDLAGAFETSTLWPTNCVVWASSAAGDPGQRRADRVDRAAAGRRPARRSPACESRFRGYPTSDRPNGEGQQRAQRTATRRNSTARQ